MGAGQVFSGEVFLGQDVDEGGAGGQERRDFGCGQRIHGEVEWVGAGRGGPGLVMARFSGDSHLYDWAVEAQ